MRHKLGSLSPVIYFRCREGHVVLAPYSDYPTPPACEFQRPITGAQCGQPVMRDGADSLPAIDKLQTALTKQENEKLALEQHFDLMQTEAGRKRVGDSLYAKLVSSATSEVEKDIIRAYLQLRPELRGKHHAKWNAAQVYIHAREFDLGKKREDQENAP